MKNFITIIALLFLVSGFSTGDILNGYNLHYLESDNFRLIKNEPDGSSEIKNEYDFHYKKDLIPSETIQPRTFEENPNIDLNTTNVDFQILSLCVWTGDMAQSIQIGRKNHPEYNEFESRSIVKQVLKADKANPILIKSILVVFNDVWENYPLEMNSTMVFVKSYNACVIKGRKIRKEVDEQPDIYL
tara:strand:+ start:531 stop:1091 length:561 start_codon:yes stop_codon:yes gene_type:complete